MAGICGVELIDILSARTDARAVQARHIAMYLARRMTTCSLPQIGRMFGGRDHSTVVQAIKNVIKMMEADRLFAQRVSECVKTIGQHATPEFQDELRGAIRATMTRLTDQLLYQALLDPEATLRALQAIAEPPHG